MLRKFGIVAVLSLLTVALAATAVLAQNPHFVRGPTFTDNGNTITATGSVAGLGNQDVRVVLTATGTASVVCINPGGNRAPGQDTTVTASGSQTITDVKNGRINFNVTTLEPRDPNPAEVCPNRKWDAQITDVTFTSATLEIFQPPNARTPVLTETFTF